MELEEALAKIEELSAQVEALNTTAEARKGDADKARRELGSLKSQFSEVDLEKYKALVEADQKRQETELEEQKQWETLKQGYDTRESENLKKIEELQAQLSEEKFDRQFSDACSKAKVLPERARYLKMLARDEYFQLDKEGKIAVKDGVLGKNKIPIGTIEEAMGLLKDSEDYSFCFEAQSKSNGDGGTGNAPHMSAADNQGLPDGAQWLE